MLRLLLLLPLVAVARAELRLPVVADTNISSYPAERAFAYGARSRARVKGIEMFYLAQFDLRPLAGQRVLSARFVCRAPQQQMRTLGFSTISADWREDRGTGDAAGPGTTFLTRLTAAGAAPWALPGGDFTDVAFTAGGSQVSYGAVELLPDGWLQAPVALELVHAMLSGASCGLCVSSETGQTRFNNDLYTREQNASAPYLLVTAEPALEPRVALRGLTVTPLPEESTAAHGAARVAYELVGEATDLARVRVDLMVNGRETARWRMTPARPGRHEVLLDDLAPGEPLRVVLRAETAELTATGQASPAMAVPKLTAVAPTGQPAPAGPTFAVPGYASVHPLTGNVLEEVGAKAYGGPAAGGYRRLNPVWSGAGLTLAGARGETVAAQWVTERPTDPGAQLEWSPLRGESGLLPAAWQVSRVWYVPDPEPVGEVAVPLPAEGWRPWPGTRYWPLLVELHIAREAAPGEYRGSCRWAGEELPVTVIVWDHTLPDRLGFDVSLNSYGPVHGKFGLNDPSSDAALAVERAYHRLAHAHRLTWTPLTYSHSGRLDWGAAPALSGDGATLRGDFTDFDRRFGALLDGSAFADLPRAGVPVDHLYLPLHEQWPGPMSEYRFRPSTTAWPAALIEHAMHAPPIEQALPPAYAARFTAATALLARHVLERGWRQTEFHGYLNNKYDYKDRARGGRGTSWWLLDEPMHRDDWLALAWFAKLFKAGAAPADNLIFRADISRPQWQRDWLDGLVDLEVIGSAWFEYPQRVRRWLAGEGARGWHYATANPVGAPNTDAVAWCLRAWLVGADGLVPWNSVGDDAHFEKPEATALLLPGQRFGLAGPVGSLRLKAFRAGQQEVERLRLLAQRLGCRRAQVAAALGPLLPGEGQARQSFAEDAGVLSFNLTPEAVEKLRWAVAAALRERP